MNKINPYRVKFYEYLNGDIEIQEFEDWIYKSYQLSELLGEDHYTDLISFNFKSHDSILYIKSLVKKFFDWDEYEKWRTIRLLHEIRNGKIEIVLATRKMRQLYLEQEAEIQRPLISIGLAMGYESELDRCPTESEYNQWNKEALKKQLEPVEWYKQDILDAVNHELAELLNPEFKTIDLGIVVNTQNLHDTFADRLRFPDFYGSNWDAFWDAITGLAEMPKLLTLTNWSKFAKTFPKDAKILEKIVGDYNEHGTENKIEIKAGNTVYSK